MRDEDYKGPSEESQKISKAIFYRKVDDKTKVILDAACRRVIDVLRKELKLEPWQCYFVVETLYKEFPKENLVKS